MYLETKSEISSRPACEIDNVLVDMQGMTGDRAAIALRFHTESATGLHAGFHGTTDEMRRFAAELIRHADITDEAQAARLGEAA